MSAPLVALLGAIARGAGPRSVGAALTGEPVAIITVLGVAVTYGVPVLFPESNLSVDDLAGIVMLLFLLLRFIVVPLKKHKLAVADVEHQVRSAVNRAHLLTKPTPSTRVSRGQNVRPLNGQRTPFE